MEEADDDCFTATSVDCAANSVVTMVGNESSWPFSDDSSTSRRLILDFSSSFDCPDLDLLGGGESVSIDADSNDGSV